MSISSFTISILESPFAASDFATVEEHETYARAAMRDMLMRYEAPFASHLLYTQPGVLRDDVPKERAHGIVAGFAWSGAANRRVWYCNYGFSKGMRLAHKDAKSIGQEMLFRAWFPPAGGAIDTSEPAKEFNLIEWARGCWEARDPWGRTSLGGDPTEAVQVMLSAGPREELT